MQYHKKILPLFLILIASSVFGKTVSRVTNKTDSPITVYWTAAGCTKVKNGVTETCKYQDIQPNSTGVYKFNFLQTDIQIKISSSCQTNNNKVSQTRSFYCPSGPWHINGGYGNHKPTCKLHGKGRGHVKNVIIDNFNAFQTFSENCFYIED